jgi:deoxyadenosine/deoxycytidine kinase
MDLERCHYVVIEGPIGAGKTSLAKALAAHLHADALLEEPQANPFLGKFYEDRSRYAFATQLHFLFQRADQVRPLAQLDLFNRATVADFMLDRDTLFARLNLSDEEFALYEKIYTFLAPRTVTPDLVIYLQAPPATLLERVAKRGHAYERSIGNDYLTRLADSYARYFHAFDAAPLLIVNSEHLNFVDEPAHFDLLLDRIGAMRGPREFFSLGSI